VVGEDAALAAAARENGVDFVAAPDVLTYHVVVPVPLPRYLGAGIDRFTGRSGRPDRVGQ
jgi:hypothetical protein